MRFTHATLVKPLSYVALAALLFQAFDLLAIHTARVGGAPGGPGTGIGIGGGLAIAGGVSLLIGLILLIAANQEDQTTADGCLNNLFYVGLGITLLTVGGILAIVGIVLWAVEAGSRSSIFAGSGLRRGLVRMQLRTYERLAERHPDKFRRTVQRQLERARRLAV